MPQLDGITAKRAPIFTRPAPAARQEVDVPKISIPRQPRQLPKLRIPSSVLALAVIIGSGLLLAQHAKRFFAVEASSLPPISTTHSTEPPIDFVQAPSQPTSADRVITIDQPTANSIAQPDTVNAATTTSAANILPTVRILNGGATAGKASDVRNSLEAQHYHVLSIGSAQFTYVRTTIYYVGANKDNAKLLAKTIGQADATLTEDPIASPADVLIVLGTDTR